MTDAELIEHARELFQGALERTLEAMAAGKTLSEFFAGDPMPSTTIRVALVDLREVGSFDLKPPSPRFYMPPFMRKHWVYEHNETKAIYSIGYKVRRELHEFGYAELHAMVNDPEKAS